MISRIAPTLLFVLATMVSAKELAVVQKDFQRTVRPIFQKFCFDCHGENKSKAGIRVDYLDGTVPDKEVRHWEIIRKQLLEEEMPPEDEAQPSKADRAALVAWIDGALQMARTRARPKNGGARRLTVAQYRNTLRDLLGVEEDLTGVLPPDGVSKDGFVNNGQAMLLSPLLVETYFEIAERAMDLAIVDPQAKSLNQSLGKSDREKMDQYLTSLNEVEERLVASEKWIDIPLKKQDHSHLKLDAHSEGDPGEYYRTMFDLIALAFDADITRSIAFMLNREDGMGISDTFPIKLGIKLTHHSLSHAQDKDGQLMFAKYDQFLTEQLVHFFKRLQGYKENQGTVLDNTIVLYGSGASTTHLPENLPTLVAGGANMGLKHDQYWRNGKTQMSDVFLSILHSLGVEEETFADSKHTGAREVFTKA